MNASEFDDKFDNGETVIGELDLEFARRPDQAGQRLEIEQPDWMLQSLDREAQRLGLTRQVIIRRWLTEHPEQQDNSRSI
jgi:hypothetical protein